MPLWPRQKKSGATRADPGMPRRRLTEPSGVRTERPRHFSVKNMAPSAAKAMSHGLLRPERMVVRVRAGVGA